MRASEFSNKLQLTKPFQNESSCEYPSDKEAKFILVFASAVINLILDTYP